MFQILWPPAAEEVALEVAGRIRIPHELPLLQWQIDRVKKDLTFVNPAFAKAQRSGGELLGIAEYLYLWQVTPEGIYVPRGYLPTLEGWGFPARRIVPDAGNFEHTVHFAPRQDQIPLLHAIAAAGDEDILLQMPCGIGKSYLATQCAAKKVGRILVVAHTEVKKQEWIDELQKILGLKLEDIGIIQASRRRWKDKPVTVTMLKTLAMQDFPPELLNGFQTVVYDESHMMPSFVMSRSLGKINGRSIFLTATPPTGTKGKILRLNGAANIIRGAHSNPRTVTVLFAYVGVESRIAKTNWRMQQILLGKSWRYMSALTAFIRAALEKGRKMMVLGASIDPLMHIYNKLPDYAPGFVIGTDSLKRIALTSPRLQGEIEAAPEGAMTPKGMKAYIKWVKRNTNPILGTGLTKLMPAGTGMDVADLDGGVICYPVSDPAMVEQLKGRWDRPHATKQDPKLVVFVPQTQAGIQAAESMKRTLQGLGCVVQDLEGTY